ncbi:hypothetical protein [Bradyrhizobium sp. ARR65]|uniref:hypothetical protein n=1 Tax=Bradyrhizobium sp. ARR65 TaxID=1040989 RepID=UPI000465073E|nr:hypothetical protein [Bradyrhizobium sp. ARR65]
MFEQSALRDELQSLKADLSRLLNAASEDILNSSKSRAEALAGQVKTALSDLGEVLGQEEDQLEKLLADRPVSSLASAFTLGVVVGLLLRRH